MPAPLVHLQYGWVLALMLQCSTLCVHAAILRVPTDFPGVQMAMDASQAGDTVLVDRGVWTGLLNSPAHTLLLCSNYLFTQDSTDIVETVLDGEYAGTILKLNATGDQVTTVTGFTLWRGQGVMDPGNSNDVRAGAIQLEAGVNGYITDIVVAECRAPRKASVLFMGTYDSPARSNGNLTLRRVHCWGNTTDAMDFFPNAAFILQVTESRLIIDGLYWDGGGREFNVLDQTNSNMDTLALANVRLVNCNNAELTWFGLVPDPRGSVVRNIYSDGCKLNLRDGVIQADSARMEMRNIEITGIDSISALYVTSGVATLVLDSIRVHHNRIKEYGSMIGIIAQDDRGHVLRNLEFHHNVHGDSADVFTDRPYAFIWTEFCSVENAHIHDNRLILPGMPNVGDTPGNSTVDGGMLRLNQGNLHIENVTFENNSVDDLDVYTDSSPDIAPNMNFGRELHAIGDSLTVRNLIVRDSRIDNPVPEVVTADGLAYAGPGYSVLLFAYSVDAKGILLENCDDGGITLWGDIVVEGAVLRNVERTAFGIEGLSGLKRLRNIHVENTAGGPNWLLPQNQIYSQQAFLWASGGGLDQTPTIDLENVTVTGCTNIRHLFSIWNPATLIVRNSVFYNNSYDQMLQLDTPTPQTWEYNIVEEAVPGIGNQVGIDPWFDEELGAPWLSPISPAIDAGHPNLVYNDIEDPENPGFAFWPSQGTLRNDIGYTGGPYAGTLEHIVAVRKPVSDPPTRPAAFTLHPAYPNPFNPSTTLSYTLDHPMQIELSVYNLLGQQLRTLTFGLQDAGEYSVPFTAGELASGVYVVEFKAGGYTQTQKLLLLK